MMRALAERAVDLGDVVSALYPATVAPYRRTGWEIVGAQTRITIDSHHLRGLGASDVRPRPGTKTDAEHVHRLLAERYTQEQANGAKLLTTSEIEEALTDKASFSYLTDGGFVFYEWHGSDLSVSCLVASSEASARALWSVVGSGSSVAKKIHAYSSPDDPIHLLLPEEVAKDTLHTRRSSRMGSGVHRSPPLSRGSARSRRGGRVGPRGYSTVLRVRMGKQAWPTTNGNRGTRA